MYRRANLIVRHRRLRKLGTDSTGVTVSLTTYPARISGLWLTLRSILQQHVMPDRLVVNLAVSEFPSKALPSSLTELLREGVEINWVENNTRSYKKLIPVLDSSEGYIATVDDDVLYPQSWLRSLLSVRDHNPTAVIGVRAKRICLDKSGAYDSYWNWPQADPTCHSSLLFLTGVGGILYPPGALSPVAMNLDLAMRLCPSADDIWFKAMALIAGTPTAVAFCEPYDYPANRSAISPGLASSNVLQGLNDVQWEAVDKHFSLRNYLNFDA